MQGDSCIQLITIITEAVLESKLTETIESLGATGYTVIDVRGKGHKGVRSGEWRESANIKVEIVCSSDIAVLIFEKLKEKYFDHYGMIIHKSPVEVLRSEKF